MKNPLLKRTVEGDLRNEIFCCFTYGKQQVTRKIQKYLNDKTIDVEASCKYRTENIKMVPTTEEEINFDEAMAKAGNRIGFRKTCRSY